MVSVSPKMEFVSLVQGVSLCDWDSRANGRKEFFVTYDDRRDMGVPQMYP